MTRWLAHGAINIIWTKKIYNDLHVRIYIEKICVLRWPFFFSLTHSLCLFLSLSFSHSLTFSASHSLALTRSPLFHACIRLACTYSINRELRYCTASPHLSALVDFTPASCVSTPSIRSSHNALRGGSLVRPREQTHRFFRSNKYQQRDSYTGSNPSLSYALINYCLTI